MNFNRPYPSTAKSNDLIGIVCGQIDKPAPKKPGKRVTLQIPERYIAPIKAMLSEGKSILSIAKMLDKKNDVEPGLDSLWKRIKTIKTNMG